MSSRSPILFAFALASCGHPTSNTAAVYHLESSEILQQAAALPLAAINASYAQLAAYTPSDFAKLLQDHASSAEVVLDGHNYSSSDAQLQDNADAYRLLGQYFPTMGTLLASVGVPVQAASKAEFLRSLSAALTGTSPSLALGTLIPNPDPNTGCNRWMEADSPQTLNHISCGLYNVYRDDNTCLTFWSGVSHYLGDTLAMTDTAVALNASGENPVTTLTADPRSKATATISINTSGNVLWGISTSGVAGNSNGRPRLLSTYINQTNLNHCTSGPNRARTHARP